MYCNFSIEITNKAVLLQIFFTAKIGYVKVVDYIIYHLLIFKENIYKFQLLLLTYI